MAASNSDNNSKPRTNIFELLPEVYRSDLNESLFETSYNRHLTKDDTSRVSGFIGIGNPDALVDRQIQEPTPHRQAYQLAPTMYTKVGSVDHVLTQEGFFKQLELIGVDINRLQQWGNTLQFNWVPPVNINMLINYFDYYWSSDSPNDLPQYFTIENRCNKAKSKAASYQKTINQVGVLHTILSMHVDNNSFVIVNDHSSLFTEGFVFFTKNTVDVNIANTFWTTQSSTYDDATNETTIFVQEDIAIVSTTTPPASVIGRLWYKPDTDETFRWNGLIWTPTAVFATGDISLEELLEAFQRSANCICNEDFGWDLGLWDDNQLGSVLWNASLLLCISHPTEAAWILANNLTLCHPLAAPQPLDLWYDTSTDELKQRNLANTAWVVMVNNFSSILALTTGRTRWDLTLGCVAQELNQWSAQNKWIHRTEVQSFANIKRAQIPILEYNSTIEMSTWTETTYPWKYRELSGATFETSTTPPYRFELEPIKGYAVTLDSGKWYVYLFDKTTTLNRDVNHTAVMQPGTLLRFVDDGILSQTYTVASVEYRLSTATDPIPVRQEYFVTVVELVEPVFTAPLTGGGILNVRIEPSVTSKGDVWRGYHVHWLLDVNNITKVASTSHAANPILTQSLIDTPTTTILPNGVLEVGIAHQEFTTTVAGVTTVNLATLFNYDPLEARYYATPNSNELRVYVKRVNDDIYVRQYGTYTENTAVGIPNYTAIGTNTTILASIPYVTSVTFTVPLDQYDIVRMEICPASFEDMGLFAVPVRTVENETTFAADVVGGTQPEYRSLTIFQRVEQVKIDTNQYPLFNVYDVCDAMVINASPLFAYKEDSSYPVNPNVRRRIVASSDNRDFTFIQYLLDRDDNILYGFRNLNNAPEIDTYWYSEELNSVLRWDGLAWTDSTLVLTTYGYVVRKPVISATEPTDLLTVEGALWLNTITDELFQRNAISMVWVLIPELVISDADPSLQTVWQNGDNHEYIPEYVDADRNPVPIGDPLGAWEVLDQWFYNSEHKNKMESNYSQIVTHFRSIIDEQPDIPGLQQGGVYSLTQNEFDYGLGGIMKEHNDSFDTLISAINVTNANPVGLMEWAEDQYTTGLLFVRDIFNRDVTNLYGVYTQQSIIGQQAVFATDVIQQIQFNDFLASVYGDTSAFNEDTDVGMPNWPATVPMFRLGEKYQPHLNVGDDFTQLFHHDGHRSFISYTAGELDRYARQIVAISDPRVANGTLGIISSTIAPATEVAFLTAFGGPEMRVGVYWYRVGGGFRNLYRFMAYAVQPAAPSFLLDGVEIPNGTRYYNTTDSSVYIKATGPVWVVETVGGAINTLWQEIDMTADLASIELQVEQNLYDITPDTSELAFDYSTLTPTPSEQTAYDNLYERRFYAFVAERNIQAPLVNTTYSATNAFTWNYVSSVISIPPRTDITPDNASAWQEMYTRWYGTPYPHLEPWKLQGFHDKPSWWDDEYLNNDPLVLGDRRWKYTNSTPNILCPVPPCGMWENIRVGTIPVTGFAPDGTPGTGLPGQVAITYNYFSVNISDDPIVVGAFTYDPDDVFPPYFNLASSPGPTVRSLFGSLAEIVAPDADYAFGDVGPSEWLWTVSSEYVYDIPIIAFQMQPVRFMHYAFGINFIDVDKLQVETTFCQPYSHEDILFHGDIYDTNLTFVAPGLNQWYVNFNRFSGYDTNAEFRALWAGWNPTMSYQFAGIVDTSTFEISSKYFGVIEEDYDIVLANTGVFKDLWAEGFEVSVLNIPPAFIQYNNQAAWKFDVDSLAAIDREISYYGVRLYQFALDVVNSEGNIYQYSVLNATSSPSRFFVSGDQSLVFLPDITFTVSGSSLNDGVYTVASAVYIPSINQTRINTVEIVPSSVGGGTIDITSFSMPWVTGDGIVIQSTHSLPAPLFNGVQYYIIVTGPRSFQLAGSPAEALALIPITLTSAGAGEFTVGEIAASFVIFGANGANRDVWYHYTLDKNQIISITPPTQITGMQTLINVFDGYAAVQTDAGEVFNSSRASEFDEETGRSIGWQLEIERFIDWAYSLQRSRLQIADRYDFTLNAVPPTSELMFTGQVPSWLNGTPIAFQATGSLPAPLIAGVPYYFVQTATPGVFNVSISSNVTVPGNIVTLTTNGSGTLQVAHYRAQATFPSFEINPSRNNIWIDTPQGLLANVVTGPFADIRVTQSIFDQYGRPLTADKLNVFRQDKQSRIAMRPQIVDDQSSIPQVLRGQYDYLHMGGGHFFLEGYEHVILFNDYAVGGELIYDQFYGLYTTKFNLDYYEKNDYTLRPTLGGYYLEGNQFFRNIEGSTVDLHNYYDTYDLKEKTTQARYARGILGYKGTKNYLDLVNLNAKSQFLFYRGMIQYKGSVAGAKAYINSRRFIDAKIDEFWAWKIAEFGDSRPRTFPQIKLLSEDSTMQDVRMQFLAQTETLDDPDVVSAIEDDFIPIQYNVPDRWEIWPEQKAEILSPLFLDADVTSMFRVFVSTLAPTQGQTLVDYWWNPSVPEFRVWNGTSWIVATDVPIAIEQVGSNTWVRLDQLYDDVRVVQRKLSTSLDLREYETIIYTPGAALQEYQKVNSEIVKFNTAGFTDVMVLFTINPGFSKISPSKLIDTRADVVVSNVQMWDPARNHHSTIAIHNVDLQNTRDPVLDDTDRGYLITPNPLLAGDFVWGESQVGTRWMDMNSIGYLKYYDDLIYPDVNVRLNKWGNLAPWGSIKVCEWTSSSVPPDEWAQLVAGQSNDTRPQRSKASGTARQTLFKRTRPSYTATAEGFTSGSQTIDFTPAITGATLTGLALGTAGYQDVDFTIGGITLATSTGLTGTAPFQANVFVDGNNYFISISAASAATYGTLITQLNAQLLGSALVVLFDGNTIRITSNTFGLGSTVIIQDINLFGSLANAPAIVALNVPGASTTYTSTITIDGTAYALSILGDDAQTFTDLVDFINAQISGVGSVTIVGGDLVVTSASMGTSSTVAITAGTLFTTIFGTNPHTIPAGSAGVYGVVRVIGAGAPINEFDVDGVVLFTTTDTLPFPLEPSVFYTVAAVTPSGADQLLTLTLDGAAVNIETAGVGTHTAVPAFGTDWARDNFLRETQYGPIQFSTLMPSAFEPTITLTATGWAEFDKVDVYINDTLRLSSVELDVTLQIDLTGTGITITELDIIDIVRPLRALTPVEANFDPDVEDDGTVMIQWKYDYEYSLFNTYAGTVPQQTYYFWVENAEFRDDTDNTSISVLEVTAQLKKIPTPYFVVQLPKDDPTLLALYGYGLIPYGSIWSLGALAEQYLIIPVFYRQAILRGAATLISDDAHFVWRFTRNLILRDSLKGRVDLKNKHEEWFMFRREQPSTIPRDLWDRLTEALIGQKLDDPTARVPSLEREFYDAVNGTDTQYGLAADQAFTSSQLSLQTVIAYLENPDVDFQPIDIDNFFATHTFDTPNNITTAMNDIYNTFSTANVNNIWFETLQDALSVRAKYKELLKTSWIALHGIRVLEVGGLFDD